MHLNTLALVAGAAVAAADSTVTLFLPGFDTQSIDAKVLGSSKSMTTYLLNCPPNEDSDDCGLPESGFTVTAGPSSVILTMVGGSETIIETCKLDGTTSATCWGEDAAESTTASMSTAFAVSSIPYGGFMPVHITATETGGASATTGASASATTAVSTSESSGTASESTTTGTSTGTASSAAATSQSSNAALPMMTGSPLWVAGGAAALAFAL